MIEKIKQIAEENPDGFTIFTTTLEHVKSGWVVAMKETQNSFGDEGLKRVLEVAEKSTKTLGGWKEGKLFYFDAVHVLQDREEAIRIGKENEQIAIYHLETGTLIYL